VSASGVNSPLRSLHIRTIHEEVVSPARRQGGGGGASGPARGAGGAASAAASSRTTALDEPPPPSASELLFRRQGIVLAVLMRAKQRAAQFDATVNRFHKPSAGACVSSWRLYVRALAFPCACAPV
jgi:hypothetical protein